MTLNTIDSVDAASQRDVQEEMRSAIYELQRLKFTVVAGAGAATNIAVAGIATEDTLVAVIRLDRDATAANINMSNLIAEASITSAGNIQNSTTVTTGDALMVVWFDKN